MLVDKVTINVGENNSIYIEMYSKDTPSSELKYGDVKYNDKQQMVVWYGDDNPDVTGWHISPFGNVGYAAIVLNQLMSTATTNKDSIYRILNNDLSFNEAEYLASQSIQPGV